MRSARSDDYRRVLNVLVAARKNSGLTQQELARRIRKPQSFVSKYETGERRLDVAEFVWLIGVLGSDPRKLFEQLFGQIGSKREQRRHRSK